MRKLSQHVVYADALGFTKPIDVHKEKLTVTANNMSLKTVASSPFSSIDFSWLPYAAKEYHISPNADDYVLVPVIVMPSELPNRNGVGFPLKSLLEWSVDHGAQAYKTFNGKPVHVEHDNLDPTKAIGVIVDSSLKLLSGFGQGKVYKLVLLLAIDRTKDPARAQQILIGKHNAYSMGAYVGSYSCSYCGSPAGQCAHINLSRPLDFYVLDGKLVYRRVHNIVGFECSSVETPAYLSAISDTLVPLWSN